MVEEYDLLDIKAVKALEKRAYEAGLNDAWQLAIHLDGMTPHEMRMIFGDDNSYPAGVVMATHAPSEVMKLIKEKGYKVGDVITDGRYNYLITDITDVCYKTISGEDFEPVSIGKDYISTYWNTNDSKDLKLIAEEIWPKFNRGETIAND